MIIGLTGFINCGKGTVGDILVEKHEYTKASFADAVKDATSAIFGWPRALLEGDTDESRVFRETADKYWTSQFGYEVTPRLMLQKMGTEAGRDVFHKDVWVSSLMRRIADKPKVVIPDVRFPNEIAAIRQNGGFIVRVIRGSEPEWFDTALAHNKGTVLNMYRKYPDIHVSEWAWIGTEFDYMISNNGTILMIESDINHMLAVFSGPAIIETSTEK